MLGKATAVLAVLLHVLDTSQAFVAPSTAVHLSASQQQRASASGSVRKRCVCVCVCLLVVVSGWCCMHAVCAVWPPCFRCALLYAVVLLRVYL